MTAEFLRPAVIWRLRTLAAFSTPPGILEFLRRRPAETAFTELRNAA